MEHRFIGGGDQVDSDTLAFQLSDIATRAMGIVLEVGR
jgi:hypothetical protein